MTYIVDLAALTGIPMPIALLLLTGLLRGGSTVLRTRTMPEVNKNQIINMIADKQKGLLEFCVTASSQKYHYNLPSPSRSFLPSEARTDYRNFNKFKNILKKRSGICLDTHIEDTNRDPYLNMKMQMKPILYPSLFFIAASQEVRAAMRLGVDGLDIPFGFIENLTVYDSTTTLIGCSICAAAMVSRSVLPAMIQSNHEQLEAMKNPKNLMKLAAAPAVCFALYPLMSYIEMAPLFQYSFVVGCLVNNIYMISMESNLLGLADKTGYKSQGELQTELVRALADEPEFKKVYDQRLFDKQIKEASLEFPDSFFQRFRYFKNEKELSFILSVMSSLLKREITNYSDLQANLEQDQIGSIYPFEIRPNSYWEKKTEMIKEGQKRVQRYHDELIDNERSMYLQRNEGIPDQVDLGSIYDSYERLKEENTEIRQIYESQKLENILREKEDQSSIYPWYIRAQLKNT